jgi:hypothetical protein
MPDEPPPPRRLASAGEGVKVRTLAMARERATIQDFIQVSVRD